MTPPASVQATRPLARGLAMAVYAAVLVTWSVVVGVPNDTVQVFLWLWLGVVAWNVQAPPRQHLQFLKDWWLPVVGLVVYFLSRGLTDELGLPVHVQMPIRVDTWLGGGELPTERLQDSLCGAPCTKDSAPAWYDLVLTTVYATHFVAGLTIAAVLWTRSRPEWIKWMRRYLTISFGALVVYVVYPMAPPWMASARGWTDADLARITSRGWSGIGLGRVDVILQGVGNPVAAMPSLHAGIAFLIALYGVQRWRRPARWLLIAYPLAMSFALVYFAEHYVVDVAAGALLATAVLAGCSWWEGRGEPAAARGDRRVVLSSPSRRHDSSVGHGR